MVEIRGRTFSGGEKVETDGNVYLDCRFESASLRYSGGPHPSFTNCVFNDTGWYFTDGALRTIQFLQIINASPGGSAFVSDLFLPDKMITE
jgi:hypothetical protein